MSQSTPGTSPAGTGTEAGKQRAPRRASPGASLRRLAWQQSFHDRAPFVIRPATAETLQREQGITVIQFALPTLPSLNRQFGVGKGTFYLRREYRSRQQAVYRCLKTQIEQANWQCEEDDWYLIHFDFFFRRPTVEDLDGPVQATINVLKPQQPSREEKAQMLSLESALKAWQHLHPSALWDDAHILQMSFSKHAYQPDRPVEEQPSLVTVYRFTPQSPYYGRLLPIHQLLLSYLLYPRLSPSEVLDMGSSTPLPRKEDASL